MEQILNSKVMTTGSQSGSAVEHHAEVLRGGDGISQACIDRRFTTARRFGDLPAAEG